MTSPRAPKGQAGRARYSDCRQIAASIGRMIRSYKTALANFRERPHVDAVTSSLAVATCLSGLVIVTVAVNGFAPLGMQVTTTAVASVKSSLAGDGSPVSFVT